MQAQVGALREVLAQQPVGVLVVEVSTRSDGRSDLAGGDQADAAARA